MIGHQHICVDLATRVPDRRSDAILEREKIVGTGEKPRPVIATLDDVLRLTSTTKARKACHGQRMAPSREAYFIVETRTVRFSRTQARTQVSDPQGQVSDPQG